MGTNMKPGYSLITHAFVENDDCIVVSNYELRNEVWPWQEKDIEISKHISYIGIWRIKTLKNEKTK